MLKKKFLLLTIFFIIASQILIYTNNNNKTSFKFFVWTVQEVTIGKLISISFVSGLFISTFLNSQFKNHKKNTIESLDDRNEPLNNEEELESNIDIPPQRNVRDPQPTISVNYRVVKNMEENNSKRDRSYYKNLNNEDDWDNDVNDW